MVFSFIRFVYINVTSFIIVAIAVVFILFFLVSSFFCVLFISTVIIIFFSFIVTVFSFVLPFDRHNNLRHHGIHSHNIFAYFFFALKVFYDNIDIHLCCHCFKYVLFSIFFAFFFLI